jgi:hypothetical protein
MPPVDVLMREMELAEYVVHTNRRIEACQQKIDAYRRTNREVKAEIDAVTIEKHNKPAKRRMMECQQRIDANKRNIDEVKAEMDTIKKDLDVATTLPRLHRHRNHDDDDFWNHVVPPSVKYDEELAGLIFRCYRRRFEFPIPFLKLLWTDRNCPLRNNRDILLATLRRIRTKAFRIVFSTEMASDRELVRACFAKCPQCLEADDGHGNGGVPLSYLRDMDMLRALALDGTRSYRSDSRVRRAGIHRQFSRELWIDPTFMADLHVSMCRAQFNDELARVVVDKAFPRHGVGIEQQPLLDNAEFALRLAEGMSPEEDLAEECPVTYKKLSPRLRETPQVALAFVRACPPNIFKVPQSLRKNELVWIELWKAATDARPSLAYFKTFDANRCSSKELVLRLLLVLEASNEVKSLGKFASYFPNWPAEIKADREINVQIALLCAKSSCPLLSRDLRPFASGLGGEDQLGLFDLLNEVVNTICHIPSNFNGKLTVNSRHKIVVV